MRRVLFLFVLLFFISDWVQAQQPTTTPAGQSANCTQVLRLARAVYEQGRLHELENLLDGCLKGTVGETGGFATVQEQVDAYRLLCLSYIYLEEPAKADQAMLGLLNADHFFVINPTDPAEFQALYRTFRTEPIFSYGVKVGVNATLAHVKTDYYVASGSAGQGKYGMGMNFSGGAFIDKELFANKPDKSFLKWTSTRLEVFYNLRNFNMENTQMTTYNAEPGNQKSALRFTAISKSAWFDVNLIARYRYNRKGLWDPYFGIGPGISLLINSRLSTAKIERIKISVESDNTVTATTGDSYSGAEFDLKSAYNTLGTSVSAVWGVNRRFGAFFINGEVRYQYGFTNLINPDRYTVADMWSYGEALNGYSQSNIYLYVGFTIPHYVPKKLTKRK